MDTRGDGVGSRGVQRPAGGLERVRFQAGWSHDPRHRQRRRRAFALLALLLFVIVALVIDAGGGKSPLRRLPALPPGGFFSRIQTLAGTGARSFAGVERAAENAAITRTLSYTPYVRIAGAQHRELALTFDDGPGPYTPEVLSILERDRVPATFFEVGVLERYFHGATSAIAAAGDTIGDHTYSHEPMSQLPVAQQRAQLLGQIAATGRYGAPYPRLFRPPYGLWDSATLALLARYRMLMVLWTIDTADYRRPGVPAIISSAVAGARPGAIILLHDAGGDRSQTVAALPKIIADLRARGYRLVTVPKLLLDNPAPANQHFSAIVGSGS